MLLYMVRIVSAHSSPLQIDTIQGRDVEDEDEEEWTGITSSPRDKGKQRDEEYEDEQVLATVTVVEDFDPDAILHGPSKSTPSTSPPLSQPKPSMKSAPKSEAAPPPKKSKSQKTRYQTKEARKLERSKQLARRTEKAERVGGRAARKTSSKKKGKSRR